MSKPLEGVLKTPVIAQIDEDSARFSVNGKVFMSIRRDQCPLMAALSILDGLGLTVVMDEKEDQPNESR